MTTYSIYVTQASEGRNPAENTQDSESDLEDTTISVITRRNTSTAVRLIFTIPIFFFKIFYLLISCVNADKRHSIWRLTQHQLVHIGDVEPCDGEHVAGRELQVDGLERGRIERGRSCRRIRSHPAQEPPVPSARQAQLSAQLVEHYEELYRQGLEQDSHAGTFFFLFFVFVTRHVHRELPAFE